MSALLAADLHEAGYSAAALRLGGYTPAEMREARYTAAELRGAGVNVYSPPCGLFRLAHQTARTATTRLTSRLLRRAARE